MPLTFARFRRCCSLIPAGSSSELQYKCQLVLEFQFKPQKEWRIPPENDAFFIEKWPYLFCNSRYNGAGLSETLNRDYERTTTAHNTLTFDGCQQAYLPAISKAPVANSSWSFTGASDFVSGSVSLYEGLTGSVTHQRGTLYVKASMAGLPEYIVVVDRVTGDRARTVQACWHAHPLSTVTFRESMGLHAATITGVDLQLGWGGKPAATMLSVIPSTGGSAWLNASIVRGQKGNASIGVPWQGWYSSNYNGNSTAPTLVFDGAVPKTGALFGWLLIPQKDSSTGMPVASLTLDSAVGVDGTAKATVTIAGREERVSLPLGVPPAPPPPCAAGTQRICGVGKECMAVPKPLSCPSGQKLDVLLVSGDDGSCSCDEYCATNWGNHVKAKKPHWTGATSAFGKNSSVIKCGSNQVCACIQAAHFCPEIIHLCKAGCDSVGSPQPRDYCVPA